MYWVIVTEEGRETLRSGHSKLEAAKSIANQHIESIYGNVTRVRIMKEIAQRKKIYPAPSLEGWVERE